MVLGVGGKDIGMKELWRLGGGVGRKGGRLGGGLGRWIFRVLGRGLGLYRNIWWIDMGLILVRALPLSNSSHMNCLLMHPVGFRYDGNAIHVGLPFNISLPLPLTLRRSPLLRPNGR